MVYTVTTVTNHFNLLDTLLIISYVQGISIETKLIFRYFMMGVCQRGDNCPYSHDRSISNKGTIPCRFYQVITRMFY